LAFANTRRSQGYRTTIGLAFRFTLIQDGRIGDQALLALRRLSPELFHERSRAHKDVSGSKRARLTDTTNHALLPPCGSEEASQHARRRAPPIRPRSAAWL
jgi:hypothetical protein